MVHIICRHCKRIIHLENSKHWNFKGKIDCARCGKDMSAEIKNGEILKKDVED